MTIQSANFFRKTVAVLPSRHALPASGMRSSRTAAAFIFMLGVGCTEPEPPICEATDFTEEEVEVGGKIMKRQLLASVCGPAYALRTDIDADGQDELVISSYGKAGEGEQIPAGTMVALGLPTGEGGSNERRDILPPEAGLRFPHRPFAADVDGDNDVDFVVGVGFFACNFVLTEGPCGGLVLLLNDGTGAYTVEPIVSPGDRRFFHGVDLGDVDGDGIDDIVSVAETRDTPWDPGTAVLMLFQGLGDGTFADGEPLADGLGPFPQLVDIDGDDDLDIIGASFFGEHAGFSWVENQGGQFVRHTIDAGAGPSIQMSLIDGLREPGQKIALGSNHANPIRYPDDPEPVLTLYAVPEKTSELRQPWPREVLLDGLEPEDRAGQLSPGIFDVGDLDDDGDLDIVISGDGDPRVFVLLQDEAGAFETLTIASDLPQAGGVLIDDLDGDGDTDLLMTSYERDAVVFFETLSSNE